MQQRFHSILKRLITTLIMGWIMIAPQKAAAQDEINVYTTRQNYLIKPFFDQFSQETGIKVNSVFIKSGLIERLRAEKNLSPADVVLTSDAATLIELDKLNIFAQLPHTAAIQTVAPAYKATNNHWVGLTMRARIIATSKERLANDAILNYADLVAHKWHGKICTRSGSHVYTRAWIASQIAHNGVKDTEKWAKSVVKNFARPPQGNDRAQARAIAEGVCDIAIMNHYYYIKMLDNPEQKPWAEAINIIFPDQTGLGTHVNISAIARLAHSPNGDAAQKLIEFLLKPEIQTEFAGINGEYPVVQSAKLARQLKVLGQFKADAISITELNDHAREAVRLLDRINWQ